MSGLTTHVLMIEDHVADARLLQKMLQKPVDHDELLAVIRPCRGEANESAHQPN